MAIKGAMLGQLFLLFVVFLVNACSGARDSTRTIPSADVIVVNADVYTSDVRQPRAEAFAVRDGKLLLVGADEDVRALAADHTEIIDADGATVLPGFVDGHTHLVSGAGLATGVDLSEIEDKDEWLRIIAEKVATVPDGDWILGGAWDQNLSDGILPTKEMLDSVAPKNPVFLRDIDGHSYWANSFAIELAEVTADSRVPRGGEIVVSRETGEPTGIFKEGARTLFDNAPGMSEATDPEAGIRSAMALANTLGVTTVHDMSYELDAFLSVLESTDLTVRIWQGARRDGGAVAREELVAIAEERERIRKLVAATGLAGTKGPLFELGYVKFMVDGALSGHTALMKEPYSDNPGADPAPRATQDELTKMVGYAHGNDLPVAIHAIGDRAVSWALDALAASPSKPGMLPDRIEHIEVVTPDDVERFRSLGIVASMQPHHANCCVGNYVIDRIGRQRLPNAYVWRSMLDHGIPLVLGTDWPTSPFNPLIQIADTIRRETRLDGVVQPWDTGNALTFEEALYGYTQAGANMTAWSDQIGSISAGKWADFVILHDRLATPVDHTLASAQVAATYLAGTRVYP